MTAAIVLLLFIAGCDGRGVTLYMKPATAMSPPWSVGSVVIPVDESEDILSIVTKVAADLGMSPASTENHWSLALPSNSSFELLLTKEAGGYWSIVLRDWPSVQRSEQSKKAEAQIRGALKKPNQTPEPTSTAAARKTL